MDIIDIAAYEICKLLWEANIPTEYFHGENLRSERKTDVDGNKVAAVIEPEEVITDMVSHWSIAVTHKHVRLDIGGIGRAHMNPHRVHTYDLADPKFFKKIVDVVSELQEMSACYQFADMLAEADVSFMWPTADGKPGSRTSHVTIPIIDSNVQFKLEGSNIFVQPAHSGTCGVPGQTTANLGVDKHFPLNFSWDNYREDPEKWIAEILAAAAELDKTAPENSWTVAGSGGFLMEMNPEDIVKQGGSAFRTVAKRESGTDWMPEEGHTEEDVEEVLANMRSMVNRFHKKKKWTPDTKFDTVKELPNGS